MDDEVIYFEEWMNEHDWNNAKYQLRINELAKLGRFCTREELEKYDIKSIESGFRAAYKKAKQIEIILYKELGFHNSGVLTYKDLANLFLKYFNCTISKKTLSVGLRRLKEDNNIVITKVAHNKTEYYVNDIEPWLPAYIKKHGI